MTEESREYKFLMIPMYQIRPPELEARLNMGEEEFIDLVESIKTHGIINPLTVKEIHSGLFEIVAGNRRYLAAQRLRLAEVPCTILEVSDRRAELIKIEENFKREDTNPFDDAIYFRALIEKYGFTERELAESMNRSVAFIRSRLDLISGDPTLAEMVKDGILGLGVALKLNEISDEKIRRYYAAWAVQQGATLRLVDLWVRQANITPGVEALPTVPVTDPGSDRQSNRLTYYCQIGEHPMSDDKYRIIPCCPECKDQVLRAVEIERQMAKRQEG